MSGLNIFGNVWGSMDYSLDGARALSAQEIAAQQASQFWAMRQAEVPNNLYLLLAQYQPYPKRPLDERFADFKARLSAAIARRSK